MSAISIVRMEYEISTGALEQGKFQCPQCGSQTYVLHGYSQLPRREAWRDGRPEHTVITEEDHSFLVTGIECLSCNSLTHLRSEEVVQLKQQVFELRAEVMAMGGKDPLSLGRVH